MITRIGFNVVTPVRFARSMNVISAIKMQNHNRRQAVTAWVSSRMDTGILRYITQFRRQQAGSISDLQTPFYWSSSQNLLDRNML